MPVPERQSHYDVHLEAEGSRTPSDMKSTALQPNENARPPPPSSNSSSSWKSKGKWKMPTPANLEKGQDVFWYPAMRSLPPPNFTPGLIPVLKKALLKSHAKGTTTRAVLCYDRAVFINRQMWDVGWGCGYRNFEMSCAALMDQSLQPMYFPLLDSPTPPGIRNLQHWIEEAWTNGFDKEGRDQLKKLVDTKKWIGTSDICTAFVSRGIPAELVDIDMKDTSKTPVPLVNWIVQYFDKYSKANSGSTINSVLSGASPVQCTPCMPLIVQNDGHSRMVVGYEVVKGGAVNLLVFDSSHVPSKRLRSTALSGFLSATVESRESRVGTKRLSDEIAGDSVLSVDRNVIAEAATKRQKVTHARPVEDAGDGEIEIVGMRTRGGSPEIDLMGEKRREDIVKPSERKKNTEANELVSWSEVLKHFRWENGRVKKKKKYQILYFPMKEPLTESEQSRRKVLTSERIS